MTLRKKHAVANTATFSAAKGDTAAKINPAGSVDGSEFPAPVKPHKGSTQVLSLESKVAPQLPKTAFNPASMHIGDHQEPLDLPLSRNLDSVKEEQPLIDSGKAKKEVANRRNSANTGFRREGDTSNSRLQDSRLRKADAGKPDPGPAVSVPVPKGLEHFAIDDAVDDPSEIKSLNSRDSDERSPPQQMEAKSSKIWGAQGQSLQLSPPKVIKKNNAES